MTSSSHVYKKKTWWISPDLPPESGLTIQLPIGTEDNNEQPTLTFGGFQNAQRNPFIRFLINFEKFVWFLIELGLSYLWRLVAWDLKRSAAVWPIDTKRTTVQTNSDLWPPIVWVDPVPLSLATPPDVFLVSADPAALYNVVAWMDLSFQRIESTKRS